MNNTVPGFLASGIAAGIKKESNKDLGLLLSTTPAVVAAVFTTNKLQAAPVILGRDRIKQSGGRTRAVIVNSGNANACTGPAGFGHAQAICRAVASYLNLPEEEVLMSSTGIIGVPLPFESVISNIPRLVKELSPHGIDHFSRAIMTTDTFPKVVQKKMSLSGKEITLCGIAKGAGMIMPRMATLLSYTLTDAAVTPDFLEGAFREAVDASFNAITIDGETSTNDTALILANGQSGNPVLSGGAAECDEFKAVLRSLLKDLARLILKDAEGSTKLVTIRVERAKTPGEARNIAYQIANSPLVKTALFGEDLNWGRIMAALGKTEYDIDPGSIDILFDGIMVVERSVATSLKSQAAVILRNDEFTITVDLHRGSAHAEVGTTDLTTEYIKINSAYPT